MKKLVIILAIAIMLFATLKQRTEQPAMVAVGASQNTATEQAEELPETHTEQAEELPETHTEQVEQITEATSEPVPTEATEEETAVQSPMKEYAEETETQKAIEPGETVKCIDEGNQNLAEYKSQSSRQPNPFENAPPTEIVDQPVEDLIGEGEDRPGEGKHF